MALQNSMNVIKQLPLTKVRSGFTTLFLRSLSTTAKGADSSSTKKSPKKSQPAAAAPPPPPAINPDTYLSKATPVPPPQPVGPGASKTSDYKNPEYFCYSAMSYFDLEAEMVKDRLPQPEAGNELY